MAIISQVTLIVETEPQNTHQCQAQVNYQLNFSKCEALGQFIFLEQVNLFRTDPAGDQHLATLYKTCVKAQTTCLNRAMQMPLVFTQLRIEQGELLENEGEALYVRVTLVPYAPQKVENLSNPVYL